MKEDQCAVIRDLVKESRIRESGKQYWYPEISEKIKNLLLMYYDRSMPLEDVCAFLDTTIRGNGRFGMVFTRTGIYFARYLSKTVYYINYADIDRIEVLPDRKGRRDSTAAAMTVVLKDGASVDIGTSDYRKLRLKKLLLRLREEYFSNEEVPEIRASGLVPRIVLPDKQRRECLAVIRRTEAEAALAGAGLAQIPLSDTLLITPLQIKMVIQLGRVFGIQVTESMARGVLSAAGASIAGRGISQAAVGWLPGLGNLINASTAAGMTGLLGNAAAYHFFRKQELTKALNFRREKTSAVNAPENDILLQCYDRLNEPQRGRLREILETDLSEEEFVASIRSYLSVLDFEISYSREEIDSGILFRNLLDALWRKLKDGEAAPVEIAGNLKTYAAEVFRLILEGADTGEDTYAEWRKITRFAEELCSHRDLKILSSGGTTTVDRDALVDTYRYSCMALYFVLCRVK